MRSLADLPREFALAASCAIWPQSERRAEAVRQAAGDMGDWDLFLHIVARQRIQGLAYDGIVAAGVEPPSRILATLRADAQALARQSLFMAAEALRLRGAFADAGIPVAFLKGTTLAMLAYGSLGIRHSKDIDLLVPEERLVAGNALLERAGYRRTTPSIRLSKGKVEIWSRTFKNFTYVHDGKRIEVELHWRLADNRRLGPTRSLGSLRDVPIGDAATLPTLEDGDLFAYLCLHGASHAWFRLKWLADIGALLHAEKRSDGSMRFLSPARGFERPVVQALLLSRRLLGTTLPERLASEAQSGMVPRLLVAAALFAMTRGGAVAEPYDLAFGQSWINLSAYLLGGWNFKLEQLRRDLVSEEDWLTCPLPDRLNLLYPMLRVPLWLVRVARRGRAKLRA
ncbi:MAG TPA: nucleotidyltransferase family protein [Stellaceae bacterium]|nr:nucleotidyltransferase family protein [Stellaceae bacterium]